MMPRFIVKIIPNRIDNTILATYVPGSRLQTAMFLYYLINCKSKRRNRFFYNVFR